MALLSPITAKDEWWTNTGKVFEFTVYEEDLVTVKNLTGFTAFTWGIYETGSDGKPPMFALKTLGGGIAVPTPANGQVLVTIDAADTLTVPGKEYRHEGRATDASGIEDLFVYGPALLKRSPKTT